MVRLSAPDWCFLREGMDPGEYYRRLYDLGYTGVEMVDPSRFSAARDAGLEITNISCESIERGLNRIENHTWLLPRIRDTIARAGDNGISHVIVFSGNRGGQADSFGIAICRRGIEELLPDAERAGVVLAFEMLNVHDHPDYQADHGEYGFELAAEVGSPFLKLIYDIYHMERMGDDSASDVPARLDLIAHLHVAESPDRGIPLSEGEIRYGDIVPRIAAAGYQGFWGMEFMPSGDDPFVELEKAARLFRELCG